MDEQVKVGGAYTCLDCNLSLGADWPGVMSLYITIHKR